MSAIASSIVKVAEAITATDHAMPEAVKLRTFERVQEILSYAADTEIRGYLRRANLGLAAAILISMAAELDAAAENRTNDLFAQLGYRR